MYEVRAIWRDFILLALLAPLVLVEGLAFQEVRNQYLLGDPNQVTLTRAEATELRLYKGGTELRYRFQVAPAASWYSATDLTGRRNLWIPVERPAWEEAQRGGHLEVIYLRRNPWANRPVARAGVPLTDSAVFWLFIIAGDVFGLLEVYTAVRNYRTCRQAAARHEPCRLRFWESRLFGV